MVVKMGDPPTQYLKIIIYYNKKETMPQYLGPISTTFDAGLTFKKQLVGAANLENSNFSIYPSFQITGALEDSECVKVHYGKQDVDQNNDHILSLSDFKLLDTPLEVRIKKQLTDDCNLIITFDGNQQHTFGTSAELVCKTSDDNEVSFGLKSSDLFLGNLSNSAYDGDLTDLTKFDWFGYYSTDLKYSDSICELPVPENTKFTVGYNIAGGDFNSSNTTFSLGLLNVQHSNNACLNELRKCRLNDFIENKGCLPGALVAGGQIKLKPSNLSQGWELKLYSLTQLDNYGNSDKKNKKDDTMNFICSMTVKESEKVWKPIHGYNWDNPANFGSLPEDLNKVTVNYIDFDTEFRRCNNDCATDYLNFRFISSDETWMKTTVGCRLDYEGFSGYHGDPKPCK